MEGKLYKTRLYNNNRETSQIALLLRLFNVFEIIFILLNFVTLLRIKNMLII